MKSTLAFILSLALFNFAQAGNKVLTCSDANKSVSISLDLLKLKTLAEDSVAMKLTSSNSNFLTLNIEKKANAYLITMLDLDAASAYEFQINEQAFALKSSSLVLTKVGEPGLQSSELPLICE